MKKNLKKVISAVLSLTLAVSSFVALNVTGSAATFSDVADTASYSEAVEALAALGAISGYEDGTFLPNNNITRAEVATMVVAALNMSEDAKGSGATTQFADVNANAAWAAGYVNVGVAQGFISGMSATEFAPSENVTYAQILSMLTRILGYGEFAENRGGYPNGYLTAASTAGILSGVSASANDAVTRAQVAQLIWNAIQAPILDVTKYSTSSTGSEMEKMDGKNDRDFKTVLSDKFDAYVLNVTVDETSKSNDALDSGKIKMTLTNNNDWDPENDQLVKDDTTAQKTKSDVAVGNTVAEDYLFSSAKVVAEYNDDDEWTLLYFAPTTKVVQKEVDGTLVADNKGDANKDGVTDSYIRIKKSKNSSTTTNYKLSGNAKLYVNGVEAADIKGNEKTVQAAMAASTGNTILVEDQDKSGYYNKVLIDIYATARVTSVTSKTDSTKLNLSAVNVYKLITGSVGSTIEINNDDLESGDVTLSVTKGGKAVELSSLVRDDIVSIRYDATKSFSDSKFFDILVSSDTITGKYSGYDSDDEYYTVNGTNYEAVSAMESALEPGTSYTFRLDAFGKLFDYEEEATTKNFAIVERYVDVSEDNSSAEYDYIQVMTLDGQSKTLYIDGNYEDKAKTILKTDMGILNTVEKTAKAVDIEDRVIEYTVKNSNQRINKITKADTETFSSTEYKATSNKLSKTLSSSAVVLDATDYDSEKAKTSDYKASSLAGLTDSVKYDGILVYKNSDSEYAYVIITKAGSTYGSTSNFVVAAVNSSTSSQATVDDEDVYSLAVMQNGESKATNLYISKDATVYTTDEKGNAVAKDYAATTIKQGSVFFYTTDTDGFVDEINLIYDGTSLGDSAWKALLKTTDMKSALRLPVGSDGADIITANEWGITLNDKDITGDTTIQLVLAPVYKSTASNVTVAPIVLDGSDYMLDTDSDYAYSVASDAKIYSIDMSGDRTGKEALSSGSFNGSVNNKDLVNGKGYIFEGGSKPEDKAALVDTLQMALMMVVDGTVTNALVFDR